MTFEIIPTGHALGAEIRGVDLSADLDTATIEAICRAWDKHLADPHLPASLTPKLKRAGFQVVRRDVNPMFNPEYSPDSYSAGILEGIRAFVSGRHGISGEEAEAWASDLRSLGEAGEYFFSLNRYLFQAVKPGLPSEG